MKHILREIEGISRASEKEVCGIIIKEGNRVEVRQLRNVSKNKEFCFIVDQKEFFDVIKNTSFYNKNNKTRIIGFFHSHPCKDELPSLIDIQYVWKNFLHIIYSTKTNRFFLWYP